MNVLGVNFEDTTPVNNIDVLEPKQLLHETFKRTIKMLSLNNEIYQQMRIRMPTLLHSRDYVASINKLMTRFEHTAEFYEKFLLMNMHYYKTLREDSTVSRLLENHAKQLVRFAEITKNKNYVPFGPPNCSVLNPNTAKELIETGKSASAPNVAVITDATKKEQIDATMKNSGIYGMSNVFKEYIHIRELIEIVNMYAKVNLMQLWIF
jgi:hypothetical protein